MNPPQVFPYKVSMKLTDKLKRTEETYHLRVRSFQISDVAYQAAVQLTADHGVDLNDYDIKILEIQPDEDAIREWNLKLSDLARRILPK